MRRLSTRIAFFFLQPLLYIGDRFLPVPYRARFHPLVHLPQYLSYLRPLRHAESIHDLAPCHERGGLFLDVDAVIKAHHLENDLIKLRVLASPRGPRVSKRKAKEHQAALAARCPEEVPLRPITSLPERGEHENPVVVLYKKRQFGCVLPAEPEPLHHLRYPFRAFRVMADKPQFSGLSRERIRLPEVMEKSGEPQKSAAGHRSRPHEVFSEPVREAREGVFRDAAQE